MGHTITEWRDRVERLIRDVANVDTNTDTIDAVGLDQALTQYSIDRPRVLYAEVAGAGSAYFDVPAGWVSEFSRLEHVEQPSRQNPPAILDSHSYQLARKPSDPTVEQILLAASVSAGTNVLFGYTAPWPFPTIDAAADPLHNIAFTAVSALAASLCCLSMVPEAARDRAGAFPGAQVDGKAKARALADAAREYRRLYDTFLGIGAAADNAGSVAVSRPIDFDPGRSSMFHGGRR